MNRKNIAPILAGLFIAIGMGILFTHAAGTTDTSYAPLAPLPGTITSGQTTTDLSTYLSGAIKLLIALGSATAILVAIIGGTQYVASGIAPSQKQDAKNRIFNALIGLTLMLTSYLILNSINPNLVNVKFNLPSVNPKVEEQTYAQGAEGEQALRDEITAANIGFNKGACTSTADTNCTSVLGLPRQATDGVIALKSACQGWFNNCLIQITGGTEAGHQTHGVGIPNLDLSYANTTLNNFIVAHKMAGDPKYGTATTKIGCGVSDAPHYYVIGDQYSGVYVDEPAKDGQPEHWHVCY